jgi:hypothetical protein
MHVGVLALVDSVISGHLQLCEGKAEGQAAAGGGLERLQRRLDPTKPESRSCEKPEPRHCAQRESQEERIRFRCQEGQASLSEREGWQAPADRAGTHRSTRRDCGRGYGC